MHMKYFNFHRTKLKNQSKFSFLHIYIYIYILTTSVSNKSHEKRLNARDFIATDVINPRVESFRDKFRLHEIHPARAKTVSFRATVLLFAVSVPFQPRPARFERNEESDGPLDRRRGRRRPRKLVVSIRGAAKNIRLSLLRPFFTLPIVEESLETILTTVSVAMIRLSEIVS